MIGGWARFPFVKTILTILFSLSEFIEIMESRSHRWSGREQNNTHRLALQGLWGDGLWRDWEGSSVRLVAVLWGRGVGLGGI